MLTLKQLLESDSLATIVAKLNQNFQVLSNSNGGPQGIRGPQGIPGLPGKMGPVGATGVAGPTGTILGVIPFAKDGVNTTGVGPSVITTAEYGNVGPWPSSSYDWLVNYHSSANAGEIFIDHRNNGYWKYLTAPDTDGAAFPGYLQGNPYQYPADTIYVYPDLGPGSTPTPGDFPGFYAGAGWYFYPGQDATVAGAGTVWVEDYTTYLQSGLSGLSGPYKTGPYDGSITNPLKIPNARLVTKYGTVWITSGNDALDGNSDGNLKTSNIGKWGLGPGFTDAQPGRYNAGVDRLLFKMSLDGLSYQSNITARGYTGPATMSVPASTPSEMSTSTDFPVDQNGIPFVTDSFKWWPKPQYEITLDKYSPLLFLSHRNDPESSTNGTYGTLGIYMYTDTQTSVAPEYLQPDDPYGSGPLNDNNVSKTIHLFSSRYSPDPMVSWYSSNQPLNSAATLNYGEMVLDFRRVIASNQYVCSLPTDMKLSSDYRGSVLGNLVYNEGAKDGLGNYLNAYRYRTFQGYVSAINGKSVTGDSNTPYYWEYGLGDGAPFGLTGGTHDLSSGTAGMITRRTWYGTSILNAESFNGTNPGTNDYIRNAGMLERGRRFITDAVPGGGSGVSSGYFQSELIFYTSQFSVAGITAGQQINIDNVNPTNNSHNSLPSLYVSPYRNIGIGTFVGVTGGVDNGPLEPLAKFHVHVKENNRSSDPTYIYLQNSTGTSLLSTLPTKVFAAGAFSGQIPSTNRQAVTDILLGNIVISEQEYVSPQYNTVNPISSVNSFGNAIRTESWKNSPLSTMHLGATPRGFLSIGRNGVDAYNKEFQISLSPLNNTGSFFPTSDAVNTGVGIHNLYPRARFHMYGKNLYNEVEFGQQLWTPGYTIAGGAVPLGLSGSYPFYGTTATNANSANQVVIDYLKNTYNYPVGIYEYQYFTFNGTAGTGSTGTSSPNAAAYPNREQLSPTRTGVPYGGVFLANQAYPSTSSGVIFNGAYKHGGTANAFWDPQTYIGFNLYRDLSSASGGTSTGVNGLGDNADSSRWILGTQGATANGHGNNGGAAIISSSQGELGIITIPRGRDGGRAYEQWEQRGLGTRDVLSHMKIVFDKNGNIAIGNAAGWDLDAYPSLKWNMNTGYVNYVPQIITIPTTPPLTFNATQYGPLDANSSSATQFLYGGVNYSNLNPTAYPETSTVSSAALINKRATVAEYIRLEVAAEKAWSRDGRMIQKRGFGYPANRTITITGLAINNYIKVDFSVWALQATANAAISSWVLITDTEGRIVSAKINYTMNSVDYIDYISDQLPNSVFKSIVFPHPTEFNAGGPLSTLITGTYVAPAGAIAAEWWGMSNDFPTVSNDTIYTNWIANTSAATLVIGMISSVMPTTDTRGSANIRLNNFVYGEGYGFSGGTQGGNVDYYDDINRTKQLVREKRQESPKIILSFLEKTPTVIRPLLGATDSGTTPYLKVNTVIASAQNEASLREYWIPKADSTGGTFMVFTDFLGQKEKDTSFNSTPINNTGLHLEEVVTQEFLAGYQQVTSVGRANVITVDNGLQRRWDLIDRDVSLGSTSNILPANMFPGYVRYFNRTWAGDGEALPFSNTEYGALAAVVPSLSTSSSNDYVNQIQANPIKHYSTFNIYPTPTDGVGGAPTCNLNNQDDEMLIRFGYYSGSNPISLITSVYYPMSGSEYLDDRCGDMNMWNTDDSYYENVGSTNGSVASKYNTGGTNTNFFAFRRSGTSTNLPFGTTPSGVKITINIAANTWPGYYDPADLKEVAKFQHLGLRFLYGDYSLNSFKEGLSSNHRGTYKTTTVNELGVNAPNDKVVAVFPIKYNHEWDTSFSIYKDYYTVDGVDTLYMSWDQWTSGQNDASKDFWYLCSAFMTAGGDELSLWDVPELSTGSPYRTWILSKLEIKFEYVWPESGKGMVQQNPVLPPASHTPPPGSVSTQYNFASIRRNIDKYYEIFKPTTNYDNDYGVDNKATQIRVKRINSEYALIDYNITVKVNNPALSTDAPPHLDPTLFIDMCSPRWTQYLRFVYNPDEDETQGLSQRLYGNGVDINNWSFYKNWYPGTAIVGDDISNTSSPETGGDLGGSGGDLGTASNYDSFDVGFMRRNMTSDWSPWYIDGSDGPVVKTWSGNILEMVSYKRWHDYFTELNVGRGNSPYSLLTSPIRTFYTYLPNQLNTQAATNPIYAAFGSDLRILSYAYRLFNQVSFTIDLDVITSDKQTKQIAFVGYLGAMYAMWRNNAFNRTKNTQWRLIPACAGGTNDLSTNNSFYLEVQLTEPILHIDTPFGAQAFGANSGANILTTVEPYRYLTLSGQSIVRFAQTNNTDYAAS